MIIDLSVVKISIKEIKRVYYDEIIKLSTQYNMNIQLSLIQLSTQVIKYDEHNSAIKYDLTFLIGEQEFNNLDELKRALQNKAFL